MAGSNEGATSRSGTTAGPEGGLGFELGGGAGPSVSAGIAANPSEAVYGAYLAAGDPGITLQEGSLIT